MYMSFANLRLPFAVPRPTQIWQFLPTGKQHKTICRGREAERSFKGQKRLLKFSENTWRPSEVSKLSKNPRGGGDSESRRQWGSRPPGVGFWPPFEPCFRPLPSNREANRIRCPLSPPDQRLRATRLTSRQATDIATAQRRRCVQILRLTPWSNG